MARTRDWTFAQFAEISIRHNEFHQTPTQIARAMQTLNYQQVYIYLRNEDTTLAPEEEMSPEARETVEAIRRHVKAEVGVVIPLKKKLLVTPELLEEIDGCLDLVKEAASQNEITPKRFLELCLARLRA